MARTISMLFRSLKARKRKRVLTIECPLPDAQPLSPDGRDAVEERRRQEYPKGQAVAAAWGRGTKTLYFKPSSGRGPSLWGGLCGGLKMKEWPLPPNAVAGCLLGPPG